MVTRPVTFEVGRLRYHITLNDTGFVTLHRYRKEKARDVMSQAGPAAAGQVSAREAALGGLFSSERRRSGALAVCGTGRFRFPVVRVVLLQRSAHLLERRCDQRRAPLKGGGQ